MRPILTILKLAIVALVANATWHVFSAYAPHYKFQDGVEYAVKYRGEMTDEALHEKILGLAAQFDVPLTPTDLTVTHNGSNTVVDLTYVRPIDLAPGFLYPWRFSARVDAFAVRSLKPGDLGYRK